MARRRITPEEDIQRLAERLKHYSKGTISNRIDFMETWEKYMGDDLTHKQDAVLFEKVMGAYSERYNISMIQVTPRRGEERKLTERIEKRIADTRLFDIVATQKDRQIFAREIKVQTKYGEQIRLVDNRGRYAKRLP